MQMQQNRVWQWRRRKRRACEFMYSGSSASRIWLGSCSKVITPSKTAPVVSTLLSCKMGLGRHLSKVKRCTEWEVVAGDGATWASRAPCGLQRRPHPWR